MIRKHEHALLRPLPDGQHRPLERFGLYRLRGWIAALFGIGVFALAISASDELASLPTLVISLPLVGIGGLLWVMPGYSDTTDLVEDSDEWQKVGGSWGD